MTRLDFDVAHLLAGTLVLISFLQLYQDRLYALLNVYAAHALTLAASVAWQAFVQDAPHLYLTAPFLWESKLITLDCGTKRVSWLLAMPISESEYSYLRDHGDHALERLLENQHTDFSNPDRPSVV